MCTLGESTEQQRSRTRCLHAPLRAQITTDQDVPFSDRYSVSKMFSQFSLNNCLLREARWSAPFYRWNAEAQGREARLDSKKENLKWGWSLGWILYPRVNRWGLEPSGAGWGAHTDPSGSAGGLGAGCHPVGLAASARVPEERERARGGQQRVWGRTEYHPLACVRLRSPAPVPQGSRLQQPERGARRTVHSPAAVRELRSQAVSHGARARRTAADTGWQDHREPAGTTPRLTVAAPRWPGPQPCVPAPFAAPRHSRWGCCRCHRCQRYQRCRPPCSQPCRYHCLHWPQRVWVLSQSALTEASLAIFVRGNPVAQTWLAGKGIPVGRLASWASQLQELQLEGVAEALVVGGGAEGGKYKHLDCARVCA